MHGLTRGQLQGPAFQSLSSGIRAVRDAELPPLEVYRAFSTITPDAFLSHVSAAVAWGIWLPPRFRAGFPVHLGRESEVAAPMRRRNVIGHRCPEGAAIREVDGVRIISPAWCWTQLGEVLGIEDLVVAGDALLQRADGPPRSPGLLGSNPLSTTADIRAVLEVRRGFRGRRRCLEAIDLLRARVDSAPESAVRQRIVRRGYPEPLVNARIDLGDGDWVEPDLAFREARVAVQYEGRHHGEEAQLARDIRRDHRLERIRWLTVRADKTFFTPRGELEFFARLRHAFERQGCRAPRTA